MTARRFPLAGRGSEMAALLDALSVVLEGDGRLVDIVGEPGIGKSRLLEELRGSALDVRVLRATCEAYTANTPYIVWRELLREVLHIGWQDTDDAVGERLRSELVALAPDLLPWLPLLARALDADLPPTPEMALLAEDGQREKLHESVLRFLEVELPGPSAIEIEDAHHMDDASADLLGYLTMRLEGRPWLLSVSRRPTGTGFEPPEAPAVRRIDLAPLGVDDALAMAKVATEDRPLADHVLRLVVERSGGNPQFLHDLVDAVVESGGTGGMPSSVEAAAMARVDALSPDDRALVRRAAVFGVMFDPRMLAWVLEDARVPRTRDVGAARRLLRGGERRLPPLPAGADPGRRVRGPAVQAAPQAPRGDRAAARGRPRPPRGGGRPALAALRRGRSSMPTRGATPRSPRSAPVSSTRTSRPRGCSSARSRPGGGCPTSGRPISASSTRRSATRGTARASSSDRPSRSRSRGGCSAATRSASLACS